MELSTHRQLDFSLEDTLKLRDFLATPTGQHLVTKLVESAPALLAGGQTNEILIRNGEALGYSRAVQTLVALSVPEEELKKDLRSYPDLQDDAAWLDFQSTIPK